MRERLFTHGDSLTDHELLEILLYDFIRRKDTNPIAHELLDCFCDLEGVFNASPRLLCAVIGIGPHTAERIHLVGALMRRMLALGGRRRVRLFSFGEVRAHVFRRFAQESAEKLEIYMTDERGVLVCSKSVSDVQADQVSLDTRTLGAIFGEVRPAGIILAHNHPSGRCEPSEEDDVAFGRLFQLCRMQGIRLCDSIIYANGEIYSYYREDRPKRLGFSE